MSISILITVIESDTYLSSYSSWLALSDTQKELHINSASLYIQTSWTCAGVDFEDPPEEIKESCAFYALADSVGNLFGSVIVEDDRKTRSEMIKAGSIEIEEVFSSSGSNQSGIKASFGYPDALMGLYCIKTRVANLERC